MPRRNASRDGVELVGQGSQPTDPDAHRRQRAGELARVRVARVADRELAADAQQLGGQQVARLAKGMGARAPAYRAAVTNGTAGAAEARCIIPATPRLPRRIPVGARPLDDPTTAAPPQRPSNGGARKPAPGLRAQIGATREAAIALVRAHVELARAEIGEIAGEVGRIVALVALAIAVVLFAALLLVIGGTLFLAEWLLGSMGWGVLHGILLAIGIAVAAGVLAVGVPAGRVLRWFAVAVVVALAVGGALGLELPNQLYRNLGESAGLSVEPGARPLVAGLLVGALVGLVVGIVVGAMTAGSGGGRLATVIGLIVAGALARGVQRHHVRAAGRGGGRDHRRAT